MANETREIKITIQADGTAAIAGVRSVGSEMEKFGARSGTAVTSLQHNWVALVAGVGAAYFAVKRYMDLASDAAKFKNQMDNLDALASKYDTTAAAIISRMQAASRGLMGMEEAAGVAAKMMLAGMAPDQITNITVLAERLSKVWGVNVADAMETVGRAAMTGRDRMLRSAGVLIDMKEAHEKYARSVGVSVSMLDAETKMMVGMQEIARRTPELLGQLAKPTDSAATGFGRLRVQVQDVKEAIGLTFLSALGGAYNIIAQYPVASYAAAAALGALGLAASATAGKLILSLVPALGAATSAVWAATIAMMKNPIVLAFAAAVMIAAGAFAWYRQKAKEAEQANNEYVASLQKGGVPRLDEGASQTAAQLEQAKAAQQAWFERTAELKKTKWGGDAELRAAAEATRAWTSEVARLEARYKAVSAAQKEAVATELENARRLAEEKRKIEAELAAQEAERLRKERERITRDLTEKTKVAVDGPSGRIAEIEAEAKRYRELGIQETVVAAWVAAERIKAAAKTKVEIDKYIVGTTGTVYEQLEERLDAFKREGAQEEDIARAREAGLLKIAEGFSEFYRAEMEKRAKEAEEIEKDRNAALFREQERAVKERIAIEESYAKVWGITESETIRRKAEGEREILAIRQAGLLASITEQTTWQETLKIMQQHRDLENEIEESKRRQVVDLDVRRLQIEREITELTLRQAEILRQGDLQTAQESLGRLGGGAMADTMKLGSDIAAGEDRYMQDFKRWAEYQDARIQYLEEIGASEAAIKDAWRERDYRQELMASQQRIAVASSTFGMLGSLAEQFYAASGQQNMAMFRMMQIFQIARAVMDGYSAVMSAYKYGCSIGGPPLGATMAAIAAAFAAAQVVKIASMKPGGGASVSAPGGGGAVALPATATAAPVEKVTAGPQISIHVYGSIFTEEELGRLIIPSITKAISDGVRG